MVGVEQGDDDDEEDADGSGSGGSTPPCSSPKPLPPIPPRCDFFEFEVWSVEI